MKKIRGGKTWTLPRRMQFCDVTLVTAVESYLDLLLVQARYGRPLLGKYPLTFAAREEIEKLHAIESDKSFVPATRKRLIRECEQSLGAILRLAVKHGRTKQIASVTSKQFPRQTNQEHAFKSYRAVLKHKERPPTIPEWVEQDLIERPPKFSQLVERDSEERAKRIRAYKRRRDHALREMAERFKLPITYARVD
jgi:hypothetical protein